MRAVFLFSLLATFLFGSRVLAQKVPARPDGGAAPSQTAELDELYDLGQSLFESYAPEEIRRDYELLPRAQFHALVQKLQSALQGDSFEDLAALEPEGREAVAVLQRFPGTEPWVFWLKERLTWMEAARVLTKQASFPGQEIPRRPVAPLRPTPSAPATQKSPAAVLDPGIRVSRSRIPAYDYWLARARSTSAPPEAARYEPLLKNAFGIEKTPTEFLWLAEIESGFRPEARSPAGAKGMFQLMPTTAGSLGLKTWMPDERLDPDKSGRAAARLLRSLYGKFKDWPLALAAYNAGEGRVRRALQKKGVRAGFSEITPLLAVETRLYVPKVLATIEARTGRNPEALVGQAP